jgi:outer membrane receptor for ferrienterochelin and colicin
MKKSFFGVVLVLLTPVIGFSAMVQEDLYAMSLFELMELRVDIATGTEMTVHEAPATVTVITAEDIKATGATNLADVLESVPGVHIRYHQFGFRPTIQIRGTKGRHTLLMINGVSMRDLVWSLGIFWKGLPASVIERVEVIRGPGSALYGADASAGVINVITKSATKIKENIGGMRIGSFDSQSAWFQSGGEWKGFEIGLTADFFNTNGHDPFVAADGQTRQDQKQGTNVSHTPGIVGYGWENEDIRLSLSKDHWRLNTAFTRHSNLETGMSGGGTLDQLTRGRDHRFNLDLLYDDKDFREDWELEAKLHYQRLAYTSGDGFRDNPPGAIGGSFPEGVLNQWRSSERQLMLEASTFYTGLKDHEIRMGVGYSVQDLYWVQNLINRGTGPDGNPLPAGGPLVDVSGTPSAFSPERARENFHVFLQDLHPIREDLELTAGARYDHFSDFGDALNPRLALVWKKTKKLDLKLMYGEAFRAPSFLELFADTSRGLSNSDLKPEHSKTLELGFSYKANENLVWGLSLFDLKISDFIDRQDVGLALKQQQNVGDHQIRGYELDAKWQASQKLRFSGNYTHRNPENTSFRVWDQPETDAYLRADWKIKPDLSWNMQSSWIADRVRKNGDTRIAVDNYFMTDSTLRFSGAGSWELAFSVRNLFGEGARVPTGTSVPNDLPLPGRSFYLEASYKF